MTNEIQVLKNEIQQVNQEKAVLENDLDTSLKELDQIKQDHQTSEANSDNIELLESKIAIQSEEIEAQDKFITCLKDKNELLEKHSAENLVEAENFQIQLSKMQENLHDLESALFEQTSNNAGLQKKLNEALEAKGEVDELLKTFHEKSEQHDTNLKNLQEKLEKLSDAEIKANEYKDVLDKQQDELNQLKIKMQLKVCYFLFKI